MLFIFIDWIAPSQNGTKAYCKWCKKELVAKKNILMLHSKSFRHERAKNKQNLNKDRSHNVEETLSESEFNLFKPAIKTIFSGN